MNEATTTQCVMFPGWMRQSIQAIFDEPLSSSDGGALLLAAADAVWPGHDRRLQGRRSTTVRAFARPMVGATTANLRARRRRCDLLESRQCRQVTERPGRDHERPTRLTAADAEATSCC